MLDNEKTTADRIAEVMYGKRIRCENGTEPSFHYMVQDFYSKALGHVEGARCANQYVGVMSEVLARSCVKDVSLAGTGKRVALLQTEAGLLAEARKMAIEMVAEMMNKLTEGK